MLSLRQCLRKHIVKGNALQGYPSTVLYPVTVPYLGNAYVGNVLRGMLRYNILKVKLLHDLH